jgi:hypothetical protein
VGSGERKSGSACGKTFYNRIERAQTYLSFKVLQAVCGFPATAKFGLMVRARPASRNCVMFRISMPMAASFRVSGIAVPVRKA